MWDHQVGHERYRTTHDDYNAPIQEEKGDGILSMHDKCSEASGKYDSHGIWVRCACDWHKKEKEERSTEIEADHVNRSKPQLGKSLSPRDFYKWMAALNKCRNTLKERGDQDFYFKEFFEKSSKLDKEKTGLLPIDVFYDICAQENVTFHKEEIESLLKVLKIVVGDKINYGRFIEIIDVNKPTIDIVPFHDLPKHNQHYVTSNQAARDYLITNRAELRPAGKPSAEDGLGEHKMPHATHNWSEESSGSPLNFKNK
ncbi:hypothetical protein NQ314_016819 [Rhamnusium bicolor]|uniref:Uncharacterized protein n=1 Tax=Rhamnusium bicolor TaxID=1586634 RepID=A0AAV8WUX5_9CUCU|nr:hypothetical protein NQ314_016819 [Rhamnusium bicolor]